VEKTAEGEKRGEEKAVEGDDESNGEQQFQTTAARSLGEHTDELMIAGFLSLCVFSVVR